MKPLHRLGTHSLLLLMLAALVLGAGVPPFAGAATTTGSPAALTAPEPTTVVGVVAAIGCGLGIRFWPLVVVGGPPVIAPVIGFCLLMALDAFAS